MNNFDQKSLEAHASARGKLSVEAKVKIENKDDLSVYYTPGVAAPCKEIAADPSLAYKYTMKGNLVAVITDGSAVLGLGNIGSLASMPVMEGKCALLKNFANVDAVPIYLDTQDTEEIIETIKRISLGFGAINLEDISAPRCFKISERLEAELDIPIFHDDQYGTAIVTLAGIINALKVVGKEASSAKVVISGAGAAGIAISKLFLEFGFKNLMLLDSKGLIYEGRENLNWAKEEIAKRTNLEKVEGALVEALDGADIFIGVSQPGILTKEMVRSMNEKAIVFAMANPDPEILPEDALDAGAAVVATGRSDWPNQINNVLVFPGIFRGALDAGAKSFSWEMMIGAAKALANLVDDMHAEMVIPDPFDPKVSKAVAEEVKKYV